MFSCFFGSLWFWGMEGDQKGRGDCRPSRGLFFAEWKKVTLLEGCLV